MNGLELSKNYYYEIVAPRIQSDCPQCFERSAAGLFGHGSQCLGFDDEISCDHDWGVRFCILLNNEDYHNLSSVLERLIKGLPTEYQGFSLSLEGLEPRGGVVKINEWFKGLLNANEIPKKPIDWLSIQEHELLLATNGEIWHDGPGEVTKLRYYLSYYPDDVWKKHLAYKCAEISQSCSNVGRSLQRKDYVGGGFALHYFVMDAMQIWFLLNRTYAPFYKWLYKAFLELRERPREMAEDIVLLTGPCPLNEKKEIMDNILTITRKAISECFPFTSECQEFWQVANTINESILDIEVKNGSSVWDQVKS
jgi:hypothetical protein